MKTIHLQCLARLALLLLFGIAGLAAHAQVALTPLFSNNMVIQRNKPIKIWGTAPAGTAVNVSMHTQLGLGFADASGNWQVTLGALPAGGPYTMYVRSATQEISIQNVMMGEVWVCAGQSNMERTLLNADGATQDIANANYPNIRVIKIPRNVQSAPTKSIGTTNWQVCTPETSRNFTAVGFYFARDLWQNITVPIGIIDVTWGGTVIETWLSPQAMAAFGLQSDTSPTTAFSAVLTSNGTLQAVENDTPTYEPLPSPANPDGVASALWPQTLLPKPWLRGSASSPRSKSTLLYLKRSVNLSTEQAGLPAAISLGAAQPGLRLWVNDFPLTWPQGQALAYIPAGVLLEGPNTIAVRMEEQRPFGGLVGGAEDLFLQVGTAQLSLTGYWQYQRATLPSSGSGSDQALNTDPNSAPSLIFNGMLSPILGLPIQGVAWYQGESNTGQPLGYRNKQVKLIDDWRAQWGIGDFAFITTQLPVFRTVSTQPALSSWALLRESQTHTLKRANAAMVCLIDEGEADDIHPGDKRTVGIRIGMAARKMVYNQNIVASSPAYQSYAVVGNEIRVTFRTSGSSLQHLTGGTQLRGFAIAGSNGTFVWANAQIMNANTVRVWHSSVSQPKYVRYAWADNPGALDLVNTVGLPAQPFRTDDLAMPWQ